jgi:hypothetical protein
VRVGGLLHAIGGLGADSNLTSTSTSRLARGRHVVTPAQPVLLNPRNHLGASRSATTSTSWVAPRLGRAGRSPAHANRLANGATSWATSTSMDIDRSEIAASTFVAFGRST